MTLPANPSQTKIMVVTDFWDEAEVAAGHTFAGTKGYVFKGILRQLNLDPREIYVTTVFKLRPQGGTAKGLYGPKEFAIENYRPAEHGKYVHRKFAPHIESLKDEIRRENPNVIIAMGNLALWAICKKSGIKKYRGSPLPSWGSEKRKVIPTWPITSVFKQWELRPVLIADFMKAIKESVSPKIARPPHYIYIEPTIEDLYKFREERLEGQPFLSCDIETKEKTITEIGFGTADGIHCLVVPFWDRTAADGNYWDTAEEERAAWDWVKEVCRDFPLIGQNFSYDMNYLWRTVGIPCPKYLGDTMLLHHAIQPEMEKGLGFLGSIYTNEPSWKFMRTDHATLKKGDD